MSVNDAAEVFDSSKMEATVAQGVNRGATRLGSRWGGSVSIRSSNRGDVCMPNRQTVMLKQLSFISLESYKVGNEMTF